MKMYEEINHLRKEFVYEQYTRIVEDFKDYENCKNDVKTLKKQP